MPDWLRKLKNFLLSLLGFSVLAVFIFAIAAYNQHTGVFSNYKVKISGNQFVETTEIESRIQHLTAESLLSLDLAEMQEIISGIEFVKSAQISRVLPDIVYIQIIERNPAVLISNGDNTVFMEVDGTVLSAASKSISFYPVPVITINSSEGVSESDFNANLIELLTYMNKDYPLLYQNLSEVKIAEGNLIFINDHKTRIFVNSLDLFHQLNILKEFEKTVYPTRELKDYSYIDLRVKNQVIVREKRNIRG